MNNAKNEALISAMHGLCIAYPSKSEEWIAEHANKQAKELLKFMDPEEKCYIRIGEIPIDEISNIYKMGVRVGRELGVSVYNAIKINDKWSIALPLPIKENQGNTIEYLIKQVIRDKNSRKIYLVVGDEVGIGSDNEPLLKNIKIIKDITTEFIF